MSIESVLQESRVFAPSAEFKGVPLLGTLMDVIDSIYIPRGGSEESKARALQAIRER